MQDAKRRAIIFAVLSVVLAAIAGLLFLQQWNKVNASLGADKTVYVAKQDIPSRQPLDPKQFNEKEIPEEYVTQSMVTSPDQLKGKVSVVPLSEGDQLTSTMIRPANQLTDADHRMVLLRQSNRVLFDDKLSARDRVDIVVSYEQDPKSGANQPQTMISMTDVLVVSVGKDQKVIGLELPLKEAKELIHAENFAHSIRVLKAPQKQDVKQGNAGARTQSGMAQ